MLRKSLKLLPQVFCLTVFMYLFQPHISFAASTINVPADVGTIQGAIDVAGNGDTVIVAPGTYVEIINFKGKAITVKSTDGPDSTIIDGNRAGSVVIFASSETNASVLDGFTIRNGKPSGMISPYNGGGIYISNASPVITNNRVVGNTGCDGPGIYALNSAVIIQRNTISNNVHAGCIGGNGGGIHLSGAGAGFAQIIDNEISYNNLSGGGDGGGIYLNNAGTPLIKGNIIRGNSAGEISPCARGGGINMYNSSDAMIIQNVISANNAGCGGGISWTVPFGARGPFLVNNTIVDNDASIGSGIYVNGYDVSNVLVLNNIIAGKAGQAAVYCGNFSTPALPQFKNNLFYSASGSSFSGCSDQDGLNGNITADPFLYNLGAGKYYPMFGSPAIDGGDNSAFSLPATDLDGRVRVLDGNDDGVATVDMGVFEFDSNLPRAVITGAPSGITNGTAALLTVGGSQVVSYRYAVDNGPFTTVEADIATPINLASLSETKHTVAVIGKDAAGNWQVVPTIASWVVDTTPPTTTPAPSAGVYAAPQSITLTCSDGSGTGCAATYYCLGAGCTPTSLYSDPIDIAASTDLRFYSRDLANNGEAIKTATYTIVLPQVTTMTLDPSLPNGANGWYVTAPLITLTSNKPGTTYYQWAGRGNSYDYSAQQPTWTSGGTEINIRGDDTGDWYNLPFGFPFYGTTYTRVYLSSNGLMRFDAIDNTLYNTGTYLISKAAIAPLWDDLRTDLLPADNIYVFSTGADSVGFRWQAVTYAGSSETNFEAILYRDGRIRLNYGAQAGGLSPTIGISKGDGINYHIAYDENLTSTNNLQSILYTPSSWDTYTGSFVGLPGNNILQYYSVDQSGRAEDIQSRNIKVDSVAPGTIPSPGTGSYDSPQSATLFCSDGIRSSGCAATYYCLGSGCTPATLYSGPILISESTYLRYYSTDVAGNNEMVFTNQMIIAPQKSLTVSIDGTGSGTVTGANINCTTGSTASCNSTFSSGTMVTLTANPTPSSLFSGWSGGCSTISGNQCSVVMDDVRSVTASFTACPNGLCTAVVATGNLGSNASINALGDVVWSQYDPSSGRNQIFSSQRGQLTFDPSIDSTNPAANSLGDVVWFLGDSSSGASWIVSSPSSPNFMLSLTRNWIGKADVNDRREIVWSQQDSQGFHQIYSNTRGQLTNGSYNCDEPSINNHGDVVFTSDDPLAPAPRQVKKLPGGSGIPLTVTSGNHYYRSPSINDSGEIVWAEREIISPDTTTRIVSSTRGVLMQVIADISSVDINTCADIVYMTNTSSGSVLNRLGSNSPCVTYPAINDSLAQATQVAFGDIFTGLMDISSNLVDWYRFEAGSGDKIHIIANFDRRLGNDLYIGLFDGQGNFLAGPSLNGPSGFITLNIDTQADYSGSYYLKIQSNSGQVGYSISLSKYTNNCGVGPCPEIIPMIGNGYMANGASINSLGEVVWSQYDEYTGKNQVFSSQRGQLTSDGVDHNSPAINNLGDVVWVENSTSTPNYTLRGIIAGLPITVITTAELIGKVDINDRREVVWDQFNSTDSWRIFSNTRGLLASRYYGPSINNNGDLVFISDTWFGGQMKMYKLAAGTTLPVAVFDVPEQSSAAINDAGEMIWAERNPTDPGVEKRLVSNTRGVLIPSANITSVDVNNCGDILYTTNENGGNKLYRLGQSAPCITHPAPNDTQEQATPVAFGDIFTGLIDSTANRFDWYRFEATAGDMIHITVNFDYHAGLNLQLYDGQGNGVSGPTSYDPLGITFRAYTTGPYYLRVEGYGGRSGYSVSLSKYTTNCGVGPCPDVVASNVDFSTSINSLGEVVWSQLDQFTGKNQIFSSQRGQLTSDAVDHLSPAINNLGDLVWVEHTDSNYTLRGTIAGQTTVVATSPSRIAKIDINDRREVVWDRPDWNGNNRVYSNIRGPLTDGSKTCRDPSINNQGEVVFLCSEPGMPDSMQIYRIAGGSTTAAAVTNQNVEYRSPAINDSGEIIWGQRAFGGTTMQLVSSVGGVVVPVLPETWNIDFNNCGDIVYTTLEPSGSKLYRLGLNAPCVTHPEPNNTQEQATPVALGDFFTGLMDSTANPVVAWYLFEATAGDNIHIIVNYDKRPPNNLEIQLYGEQGPITGHTSYDPLGIDVSASSTGSYYLLIMGWGGRIGYSVSISATKPADTVPPTTAATPAGGTYVAPQTVTLSCSDGSGSGCAATYYCLGTGCNPTTPYSGGSITIATSTDLRFYSIDTAGNSEEVKTASYTINNFIRVDDITSTFFATIQAACDDTATDRTIKLRNSLFMEQIVFNRPKTLTLRGGYDVSYDFADGFTTINGSMTIADGTVIIDGIILQ